MNFARFEQQVPPACGVSSSNDFETVNHFAKQLVQLIQNFKKPKLISLITHVHSYTY